jgi:hypothetical protein
MSSCAVRPAFAGPGRQRRPPDLVDRGFAALAPHCRPLVHLINVATWNRTGFTAFVTDACSRRIVGWRAAAPTDLPLDALAMALWTRQREGNTGSMSARSQDGTVGARRTTPSLDRPVQGRLRAHLKGRVDDREIASVVDALAQHQPAGRSPLGHPAADYKQSSTGSSTIVRSPPHSNRCRYNLPSPQSRGRSD